MKQELDDIHGSEPPEVYQSPSVTPRSISDLELNDPPLSVRGHQDCMAEEACVLLESSQCLLTSLRSHSPPVTSCR